MRLASLALTVTLGLSAPAMAANLVTNGGFELDGSGTGPSSNGQVGYNTSLFGWSVPNPNNGGSYAFLFTAGGGGMSGTTADTTGANGQYGSLSLWGPGDGSNNSLTLSPNGGAFVALDSDFQNGPLQQTITGLKPGATYKVSFDWAASQQTNFYGQTQQYLNVSLGSDTQTTPIITLPSQGFSGWQEQTFTYTATSSSEVLSFLAGGGPPVPPFTLVDGVSMNAVPEPASLALLCGGILALGIHRLRRRR
jgi:hypothetical protein